jgi:hypothetical protein
MYMYCNFFPFIASTLIVLVINALVGGDWDFATIVGCTGSFDGDMLAA